MNRFGVSAACEAAGIPSRSIQSVDDLIADVASTQSSAERAKLKSALLSALGPKPRDLLSRCPIADPLELAECASLGIEVGNHTATHVHCRALEPAELHSEIVVAREKLEALSGTAVRAFSVPYGSERDLTEPVLKTIRLRKSFHS